LKLSRFSWVLAAAATSCGPISPRAETKIQVLNGIADKCGLPRSSLRLVGEEEVRIRPPSGVKYAAVDCALSELKSAGFPLKMGFVGNGAFGDEKK
jgi:hypothetical protein